MTTDRIKEWAPKDSVVRVVIGKTIHTMHKATFDAHRSRLENVCAKEDIDLEFLEAFAREAAADAAVKDYEAMTGKAILRCIHLIHDHASHVGFFMGGCPFCDMTAVGVQ